MDLTKKLKQKLKQKFHLRGPRANQNHTDQVESQTEVVQQVGNKDDKPPGKRTRSGSPGGSTQSSTSTSAPTGRQSAPLYLPDGSSGVSKPEPRNNDLSIHELWHVAYESLRESDDDLIRTYEAKLRANFSAGLSSTIGLIFGSRADRRDQMNTILQRKMEEINKDTWKVKFRSSEVQVKDMVQPVLGVINWVNEYVTGAVSANPAASIAWAGVSLLLSFFLNPVQQAASLAKGLEYISSLVVQGRLWEALYIRRCEMQTSEIGPSLPSTIQRITFKEALKNLYQEILRFQIACYCYYDTNSFSRLGQDIVKWNGWDDLLKNVQEHEGRFASINGIWKDITYAEERSAADRRHEEAISCWEGVGTDVSGLLEVVGKSQEDKKRDGLLDWLSTLDPSEAYNAARQKHTKGTSDWLIKDSEAFNAWEKSESSLLWLNGKPGCGKSILSSSVIKHIWDRYAMDSQTALAYFFFSFTDPNKQKVDEMLASLLKQIFARRPDIPDPVERLGEYKARGERPDTETLEATILTTSHGFSATFIIIDALDECPSASGEREKLLTSLGRLIATMPANIHMLCTSRAEPDIVTKMSGLLSEPQRAEIDLTTYRIGLNHDIGLCIDETLSSDSYGSWPSGLKEHAKKLLIEKADGMQVARQVFICTFQYVYCQFEALRRKNLSNEILIRNELEALPTGLDETYDRLLLSLNEHFRTQIISVLKWLTSSNRDLRLEELAEIFVLRPESDVIFDKTYRLFEPSDFIKYMSSLIVVQTIPNADLHKMSPLAGTEKKTYIRLAHFTVKEYLMSDRIAMGPANCFSLTETDAYLHVAHSSLAYYLYSITVPDSETSDLELRHYALDNWMLHLEMVPRKLWPSDVGNLAAQALEMRSNSLRTILEADKSTIMGLVKWDLYQPLRTEMLKRPHLYTAAKGFVNLTDTLIGGGPRANQYLVLEDMDLALDYAALAGSTALVQLLMDQGADCRSGNAEIGSALHAAAERGHIEVVELLLDRGAAIDAQYGKPGSALAAAVFGNQLDVVQLLVSRDSDINASSDKAWGTTALVTAAAPRARYANYECLRFLLDRGADVNIQCPNRGTALNHAAANISESGNSECVRLLLDRGADVNLPGGTLGYPLQAMCYGFKDPSDVMLLLDRNADVNARGGKFDTALQALFSNCWIESQPKFEIASLLLDRGADINMHGGYYGSVLQAACATMCSMEIAQFLLENDADVGFEGGYFGSALQAACFSASLPTAQLLLDRGANVNVLGGTFGSALQAAASSIFSDSAPELVELLLSKGADANKSCGRFATALQAACWRNNIDIVRILTEHGAEVNVEGGEYGTALQAACVHSSIDIVRILIDHGAEVNIEGGEYGTALQGACFASWGDPSIPQLLIEHGANVHQQSGKFGNAWHAAAAQEYTGPVLQLLLDHGIDIDDARGREYATALHAAIEAGSKAWDPSSQIERIGFLLDHGANVNLGGGKYGFPLQSACAIEQEHGVGITKHLLEKCSELDVNATGGHFGSALQAAAHSGQTDSVRILLDKGADVNASGGIHRSALNAAVFEGYWDIVEVLLEKGAVPDSQPDEVWLEEVQGRLGRGAVERYRKFWEKTGSQWKGVHVHSEH